MRILLDNCVHRDLKRSFTSHDVFHAVDLGWEALRNGDLLRRANEGFDLLVTVDKNMRFRATCAE